MPSDDDCCLETDMLVETGGVIIDGSADSRARALCLAHHEGVSTVFTKKKSNVSSTRLWCVDGEVWET
ncbi:unnamed protein product [Macrosiphum euphorbiae]|uniref:Uncharacterized protein n=1 Tax=Macrosiphum euphorbiae TaxID=13131 RepID=A0AAV0WSR5_9HEMI|nr:unnamed protein product [Macrosiphum euphorbiae]